MGRIVPVLLVGGAFVDFFGGGDDRVEFIVGGCTGDPFRFHRRRFHVVSLRRSTRFIG
jgi:hypothetical protein